MKKKRLVLIVEDEESLSQALLDKLKTIGEVQLLEAQDGELGLKMAFEYEPDLILLDLILPKMDGLALLRKLRESKWGSQVPVVVLTNLSVPEKEAEARKLGVEDFFVKTDISLEEVVELVKKKLEV